MTEEPEKLTQLEIDLVDKSYLTPGERASKVLFYVQKLNEELEKAGGEALSDWDLLAFAVEYIGAQVVAGRGPMGEAAALTRWFYSLHYSNPRELHGEPDREEEEKE